MKRQFSDLRPKMRVRVKMGEPFNQELNFYIKEKVPLWDSDDYEFKLISNWKNFKVMMYLNEQNYISLINDTENKLS